MGSNLLVVVLMGMMLSLQGVTKATRGPLGTTYIDNNVPARSQTAMYLGQRSLPYVHCLNQNMKTHYISHASVIIPLYPVLP